MTLDDASLVDLVAELLRRGGRVWSSWDAISIRDVAMTGPERGAIRALNPARAILQARSLARARHGRGPRNRRRDRKYLAWCRLQPCCECGRSAPSEASHLGDVTVGKGMGLKAPDATAVPHCRACHRCFEEHAGPWLGLSKLERRARADRFIAATRGRYEAETTTTTESREAIL